MKTAIRRAAIALALVSVATVSAASSLDPAPQRIVKFGDLDLTSNSGVALLYGRLRSAAREVCAAESVWNIQSLVASKDCAQQAIQRAVEEINAPQLSSYHRTRSHVSALAQ